MRALPEKVRAVLAVPFRFDEVQENSSSLFAVPIILPPLHIFVRTMWPKQPLLGLLKCKMCGTADGLWCSQMRALLRATFIDPTNVMGQFNRGSYFSVVDRYADPKPFLSIFSDSIFDSSIDAGTPNLAAAPDGPDTRPAHSVNAASMIVFSQ
jgi:hypothetical protein